jgi:serine/threonine-protein kinase
MEFLDGETLADRLNGQAVDPEVSRLRDRGCRGACGHVPRGHRSPRSQAGQHHADADGAKVLDFGLARVQHHALAGDAIAGSDPLTRFGTIVATLQHMAPEQLEGKEVDTRTDIFAFGASPVRDAHGTTGIRGYVGGEHDGRDS